MNDLHYTTPLQHLGIIRATGEDALSFLHNQLTQDMLSHTHAEARRSGWCNAKGRLLASFISVLHGDDEVLLICSKDVLEATLKRLRMFVLRAKCTLEDASAQFTLVGSYGKTNGTAPEATAFLPVQTVDNSGLQIQLSAGSGDAAQWLHQLTIYPSTATPPAGEANHTHIWLWLEVMTGIATVSDAVREAFVPQMLNYESVAAINFKKGCYPGQEVVARSQFRGKLKRRAFLAQSTQALAAGDEIFNGGNAVGTVVQTAKHPEKGCCCILSTTIASTEDGTLHVKSTDGDAALTLLPLPYNLLEDI